MIQSATTHRTWSQNFKELYVRILLLVLAALLAIFRHFSRKIQTEIDYLEPDFTFMLSVEGTPLSGAYLRTRNRSFKRIPMNKIATDVEPGSGLSSKDRQAVAIDYVISFRSLSYAFACFSGGMTLKDALAQRAFSTRGPNSAGVALTYLFSAQLGLFFGWRQTYRTPQQQPNTHS